ncbi:hypothetical protein D3I93_02275 [Serratia marcescens]|nr:hypothetical protein D3I93_02275 [Serratia marcescens]
MHDFIGFHFAGYTCFYVFNDSRSYIFKLFDLLCCVYVCHRVTLCCNPGSANHPDLRVPRAATSWASCLFAADGITLRYLKFKVNIKVKIT